MKNRKTDQSAMAAILAGGAGVRFGKNQPKQFLEISGTPMFLYSLRTFLSVSEIEGAILVFPERWKEHARAVLKENNTGNVEVISGGETRQASSWNAVRHFADLDQPPRYVLLHDAARPFVTPEIIRKTLEMVKTVDAVAAGVPVADTLVSVSEDGVEGIIDRSRVFLVQTPQAFALEKIRLAHLDALKSGITNSTDDMSLALRLGARCAISQGSTSNVKITYPEDLIIAEAINSRRDQCDKAT